MRVLSDVIGLRRQGSSLQFLCVNSQPHLTRCRNRASARQCSSELVIALTLQRYSGGYCSGVPPLPIPNREVTPACADGTAIQCGRVGGRHFSVRSPFISNDERAFSCRFHSFNVWSMPSYNYYLYLCNSISMLLIYGGS